MLWLEMAIILLDSLFQGLTKADTLCNIISLLMLVLFVCFSIKTKCFLKITEIGKIKKREDNEKIN